MNSVWTIRLVDRLASTPVRDQIRKLTKRDIADHFVETPLFFALNAAFVVVMTAGLPYCAEFRKVAIHRPFFGVLPRRLFAVILVSLLTATFTMTQWGRVEGWSDPVVAAGRMSVVWTAAFGAALGDILPGESTGEDINDEIDAFGERLGIGDDEGRF